MPELTAPYDAILNGGREAAIEVTSSALCVARQHADEIGADGYPQARPGTTQVVP